MWFIFLYKPCTVFTSYYPLLPSHTHAETKESAFVYALTSALAVHQITTACSDELLGAECGCDTSRNGGKTPAGWIWGGCSANISYGLFFAQRFLDSRELNESTDEERDNAISQVHLHNNGAGRRVSVVPQWLHIIMHSILSQFPMS